MTPLVIGIAGGSGSGKTTFVGRLVQAFGAGETSVLTHDRYYRNRRDLAAATRARLNFDQPRALDTALLVGHLRDLIAGRDADVPVYDFTRHVRRAKPERLPARPTVIVEGILVLANAALRRLLDLKVFLDVDDDTRLHRRLERDLAERGRGRTSVLAQYAATVRPMYARFVEPTRQYADLVVTGGGYNDGALAELMELVHQRRPDQPRLFADRRD